MKVACYYYQETEQLLDERKIEIDYFKYPALGFQMGIMEDPDAFELFCRRITEKRPILLHGLYPAPHDLSSNLLQTEFDDGMVKKLIRMTKTPGLSFHPALEKLPSEIPFYQTFYQIISNARFIKEKYPDLKFVSIENFEENQWGDLLRPEIITELIKESGCGFLLDISHAYCASRWLGLSFFGYLKQLPLEKTTEIHINGWIETPDTIMCHTKINEDGYRALEYILDCCRPDIITVEYGRHHDRIGAGVPVMSLEQMNEQAKNEIEEQIYRVHEICTKRSI